MGVLDNAAHDDVCFDQVVHDGRCVSLGWSGRDQRAQLVVERHGSSFFGILESSKQDVQFRQMEIPYQRAGSGEDVFTDGQIDEELAVVNGIGQAAWKACATV